MASKKPLITLYTKTECPDTEAIRPLLQERFVLLQEINIDRDEEAARYVRTVSGDQLITPLVLIGDGLFRLSRPTVDVLDAALRRVGYDSR